MPLSDQKPPRLLNLDSSNYQKLSNVNIYLHNGYTHKVQITNFYVYKSIRNQFQLLEVKSNKKCAFIQTKYDWLNKIEHPNQESFLLKNTLLVNVFFKGFSIILFTLIIINNLIIDMNLFLFYAKWCFEKKILSIFSSFFNEKRKQTKWK